MKAVALGQHSIPDSPQPRVSGTKTFQRVFWETVITKTHAHTHTGSQGVHMHADKPLCTRPRTATCRPPLLSTSGRSLWNPFNVVIFEEETKIL